MYLCILHSVVCGVLQAFQNKLMNMNLFRVHKAPSQSPTPTVPASQLLPPPSHWCSSAIFTCKYPGRWVGSWCDQLGNINYICIWFEGEQGAQWELLCRNNESEEGLDCTLFTLFKILVCPDFEVSLTLIVSLFALRLSHFLSVASLV